MGLLPIARGHAFVLMACTVLSPALARPVEAEVHPIAKTAWSQDPDCRAYGARYIFLMEGGTCLPGIGLAPVSLQAQNPLFSFPSSLLHTGGAPFLAEGDASAGSQIPIFNAPITLGVESKFLLLPPSTTGNAAFAQNGAAGSIGTGTQPMGGAQIPAAAVHQLRISHFENSPLAPIAPFAPAAGFSPSIAESYRPAAQEGMPLNVDYLSPGDKLWLQAAYEKATDANNSGGNRANPNSPGQDSSLQSQAGAEPALAAWNPQIYSVCGQGGSGKCENQWSLLTAGCKNYWLPFVSSALFGPSLEACGQGNTPDALNGGAGSSNLAEKPAETGFARSPVKGFDIGAEYMYAHLSQARPDNPARDSFFARRGLPAFSANLPGYGGRLRLPGAD